jgi:YD repeat-containing protein
MQKLGWVLILASGTAGLSLAAPYDGAAFGNETVNYTYDELGRLTGSNTTGGPNNTRTTGTCFDKAGNRTRYDVATSAPAPCPTPTP